MRILQGFSAGGEWGGAALMSVEHAPTNKRSFFGSFPQIGVPLGMILATLFMFGLTSLLTEEQFLAWGWRVPFLSSVVLILVGYLIRRAVAESPVFTEMQERRKESSAPLGELLRNHKRPVFLAALIFAANNAAGYLVIAFSLPMAPMCWACPAQQPWWHRSSVAWAGSPSPCLAADRRQDRQT